MNFKTKLLAIAVLPVLLISVASFVVIQIQSKTLANAQVQEVENRTLNARKAELEKMNQLALNAVQSLYNDTSLPEPAAQRRAKALLQNMAFGEDGYFFVYSSDGTNIVHPRLPHLVGKNWWDLQDPNGDYVIRNLIEVAKQGGGFHQYVWNKPSTGALASKISHAVYLEKWDWMVGTGLYVDDLQAEVAAMRSALENSIGRTTSVLIALTLAGIFLAAVFTFSIRLSEQRFADARLRDLTHRIVEVQEDERKRVSHELHDGISQLLVSARYGLDQAMDRVGAKSTARDALAKSMTTIENAISEVRRISMALRPSLLDDIGLAEAISNLGREFGEQSGMKVDVKTEKVSDRISKKAQTALFRVAQEALTNIAKHADANTVTIRLATRKNQVSLLVEDDGVLKRDLLYALSTQDKLPPSIRSAGVGLRNMRERMDAFSGTLEITSAQKGGLRIVAQIPVLGSSAQRDASPENDNEKPASHDAA
ncbi:MAG: cache domain-containing protein [Pseudomonadota bacterium]